MAVYTGNSSVQAFLDVNNLNPNGAMLFRYSQGGTYGFQHGVTGIDGNFLIGKSGHAAIPFFIDQSTTPGSFTTYLGGNARYGSSGLAAAAFGEDGSTKLYADSVVAPQNIIWRGNDKKLHVGPFNKMSVGNSDSLGHQLASSYQPIDAFMIGGQSLANPNYTPVTAADSLLPILDTGIAYLWKSGGTIVPITNNLMGPWRPFALHYYKTTGKKILFVQCALGGSSQVFAAQYLNGTWDNGGTLYDSAVAMTDSALVTARQYGYTPHLTGILWIQGEQDAVWMGSLITASDYYNALSAMVAKFRAHWGSIPFYIFRTGVRIGAVDATHSAIIRQQQELFAARDTLTKIVFRKGYLFSYANGGLRDSVHYSALGNTLAGYNAAMEVAKGWAKEDFYNEFKPRIDTAGLPLYLQDSIYLNLKASASSQFTMQRNNLNYPSLSIDIASGGITTSNAADLVQNNTATIEDYGTSTMSVLNLDRYGGTHGTKAQLGTSVTGWQISGRAPNASLTPINLFSISAATASNTLASGNPAGGLDIGTRGLNDVFSNKISIKPTNQVVLGSTAVRGGAFTTTGQQISIAGAAILDTATAANGTVTTRVANNVSPSSFSATSSNITITNGYNYYFNGPVAASTNVTITNPYVAGIGNGTWQFAPSTSISASVEIPSGTAPSSGLHSGSIYNSGGSLFYNDGTTNQNFANTGGTQTLTNKTIAAGSNTITGLANSNLSGSAGITGANLAPALSITTSLTTPVLINTAAQTTVSGSASGSAVFSQPEQGASYKRVVIWLNALNGAATYTFPVAFSHTPSVFSSNDVAATAVTSRSTTSVTIIGSSTTGYIKLEGF